MRKEMDLSGGRERAFRCRNCLHVEEEGGRGGGKAVPGPYCRNPLGVFSMDDCPVLLGRECMQFAEREGPPVAVPDEEITEVYHELLRDYLRWPYWERVKNLRRKPEEIAKKTVLEVEEKPDREDEEFVYRAPAPVAEGAAAVAKEKPPEEKYPGQRASEDRHRRRAAAARAKAAESAAAAAPAAAEPGAGAPAVEGPPVVPVAKSIDEVLAETPEARPVLPPQRARGREPSRGPVPAPGQGRPAGPGEGGGRRRRRRGRGRGEPGAPRPEGGRPSPAPSAPRPPDAGSFGPPPTSPAPSPGGSALPAGGGPGGGGAPGERHGRRRRRRRRGGRGPGPGGPPPAGGSAPPPPPPPPA